MARSNEFKLMMKCIYWLCVLAIVGFVAFIAWEIFTTVDKGIKDTSINHSNNVIELIASENTSAISKAFSRLG